MRFIWLAALALTACSSLLYYPDHILYYEPEPHGYTKQDVRFQASDGASLFGWYFKSKTQPVKGTIIQFHGNAQNLTAHYPHLIWLTNHGFNLFTFDYRSYGKSKGEPNPENLSKDAVAAIEQAKVLHNNQGKFIVYAQSLGVPVFLSSLSTIDKSFINLTVLDSGFLSYKKAMSDVMGSIWLLALFSFIPMLTMDDAYSGVGNIEKLTTKTLLIHDKKDPVVHYKNTIEIYTILKAKNVPVDLWSLEVGGHIQTFNGKNNQEKFLKYIDNL